MNRTLILHLLRKEGVCARAHLAKLSSLKQATVTNIINDFQAWGLVKEVGFIAGDKGRRSIGISINNDDHGILGIRLARKDYIMGVFDLSGNLIEARADEIDSRLAPRKIFEMLLQEADRLMEKTGERKTIAIGVAIPGPYNIRRGRIELMTGFPGWGDIAIQEELEQKFRIPVFVGHDANAGVLAQYWHNLEDVGNRPGEIIVYIAVGQGIGAGIICDGELIKGNLGIAGEIGHMSINFNGPRCACGNYGCLENYCSSIAFTNEINRVMGGDHEYTFSEAVGMVRAGNPIVKEIFLTSCDSLAVGVVNIINSFDPSVIIIGDEMSHVLPEEMLRRVKGEVKRKVLPEIYENLKIMISTVNNSMVHGAAITAIMDVFDCPDAYFGTQNGA